MAKSRAKRSGGICLEMADVTSYYQEAAHHRSAHMKEWQKAKKRC